MSGSSRAVAASEAEVVDQPPRPRGLLIDDRPDNLMALAAVLEPLDDELVPARSGEEALRRLLGEEFAVIVLAVQMPVLDGFETARLIKQRERTRHIPLVFLTAISGEPEHHLRGYEVGAVDYVYKPFAPEILRAKVRVFIELWPRGRCPPSRSRAPRWTRSAGCRPCAATATCWSGCWSTCWTTPSSSARPRLPGSPCGPIPRRTAGRWWSPTTASASTPPWHRASSPCSRACTPATSARGTASVWPSAGGSSSATAAPSAPSPPPAAAPASRSRCRPTRRPAPREPADGEGAAGRRRRGLSAPGAAGTGGRHPLRGDRRGPQRPGGGGRGRLVPAGAGPAGLLHAPRGRLRLPPGAAPHQPVEQGGADVGPRRRRRRDGRPLVGRAGLPRQGHPSEPVPR